MNTLKGTGVALITPFNEDKTIDFPSLERLIEFNIKAGVEYFVVMGTTAETPTLSSEEKKEVTQFIIDKNANRLPLVIGIGGNNTQEIVKNIQETDLSPFIAILSVSPYYNKPSQEGIYQHFKAIAESTDKAIILYNVPSRTGGVGILAPTAVRLAQDFKNIVAIKEATGDLGLAMQIIKHKPQEFLVLSGDDEFALPLVYLGGHGVISVIAEGLPQEFSDMMRLGLEGKIAEANELHYKCLKMVQLIFEEGNPTGIKELLRQRGVISSAQVRLPLVKATEQLQEKIKTELAKF